MKNKNWCSMILLYLAFFPLVFLMPVNAYSYELFHTIRISSFKTLQSAEQQYDTLAKQLNDEERDHLRIEKIGAFYTVRVGKFNNFKSAEQTRLKMNSRLPQSSIMTAYIKDNRIMRIYKRPSGAAVEEVKDKTVAKPIPEMVIPKHTNVEEVKDKTVAKPVPERVVPKHTNDEAVKDKPLAQPVPEKVVTKHTKTIARQEKRLSLNENILAISSLVKKNDFKSALDIIKTEISTHPEHPDLNAWHGMVLLKMDMPLEAMKYLKKAVALSPEISDYHNALAYSLFFLKRYDGAVDAFNKAIYLEPLHVDALTGLCIVYTTKGEKEKAAEIYNKIKHVDKATSKKLLKLIRT